MDGQKLVVDGVDLTPYIKLGGYAWKRMDLDSEEAGRSLDGNADRDRVAIKYRLDIKCRPLTTAEASVVLAAIEPEWVEVTYLSPRAGGMVTQTMYSNNVPASLCVQKEKSDGTIDVYWEGIEFPLIQR